jgi:hypothetical protein
MLIDTDSNHHIGYGEEATDLSWQAEFPSDTECVKCGKKARLAVVLKEGHRCKEYASNLHQNEWREGRFWLHDAAAFAIYLCTDIDCGTATTLWDQA